VRAAEATAPTLERFQRVLVVTLNEPSREILERARADDRQHLQRRVDKGQLPPAELAAALGRIRLEPDLERAAADADFVIEAIVDLGRKTGRGVQAWTETPPVPTEG
jgi:3-hydroxyacyl-CoA dehydrogenase